MATSPTCNYCHKQPLIQQRRPTRRTDKTTADYEQHQHSGEEPEHQQPHNAEGTSAGDHHHHSMTSSMHSSPPRSNTSNSSDHNLQPDDADAHRRSAHLCSRPQRTPRQQHHEHHEHHERPHHRLSTSMRAFRRSSRTRTVTHFLQYRRSWNKPPPYATTDRKATTNNRPAHAKPNGQSTCTLLRRTAPAPPHQRPARPHDSPSTTTPRPWPAPSLSSSLRKGSHYVMDMQCAPPHSTGTSRNSPTNTSSINHDPPPPRPSSFGIWTQQRTLHQPQPPKHGYPRPAATNNFTSYPFTSTYHHFHLSPATQRRSHPRPQPPQRKTT